MKSQPPKLIAIDHDDYHAAYVGHLADGRQFFFTTPFLPAVSRGAAREFLAFYLFDAQGRFLDAHIDELPEGSLGTGATSQLLERRLAKIGQVVYGRIQVQPFQIERFGTIFGLVPRAPDDEDPEGGWCIEAQPGNYMAFYEPWDSGEYDT